MVFDYTVLRPPGGVQLCKISRISSAFRFEAFAMVTTKNYVFWDVIPCSSIVPYFSAELSSNLRSSIMNMEAGGSWKR
jgi:hypothetical protein